MAANFRTLPVLPIQEGSLAPSLLPPSERFHPITPMVPSPPGLPCHLHPTIGSRRGQGGVFLFRFLCRLSHSQLPRRDTLLVSAPAPPSQLLLGGRKRKEETDNGCHCNSKDTRLHIKPPHISLPGPLPDFTPRLRIRSSSEVPSKGNFPDPHPSPMIQTVINPSEARTRCTRGGGVPVVIRSVGPPSLMAVRQAQAESMQEDTECNKGPRQRASQGGPAQPHGRVLRPTRPRVKSRSRLLRA